jgi:hypothetical protein
VAWSRSSPATRDLHLANARQLFERFVALINDRDKAALQKMFHPEFFADAPQSGERSRGFEQFWAQLEGYPGGGLDAPFVPDTRILGDDDRWAITPAYTVVPLSAPNEFTMLYRDVYPDGTAWHIVMFVELRAELLYRIETYFAPELPAPLAESIADYHHG